MSSIDRVLAEVTGRSVDPALVVETEQRPGATCTQADGKNRGQKGSFSSSQVLR